MQLDRDELPFFLGLESERDIPLQLKPFGKADIDHIAHEIDALRPVIVRQHPGSGEPAEIVM